jgi:hypothetical protein
MRLDIDDTITLAEMTVAIRRNTAASMPVTAATCTVGA